MIKLILEKYFLNLGKCTQLKDNGIVKPMEENVLPTSLAKKEHYFKEKNLNNKNSLFKWSQTTDGLTILNIGLK